MATLTDFQKLCIQKTVDTVDKLKVNYTKQINQVDFCGDIVIDVVISLNVDDITVWIYSDDAQFRNEKDIDERFESEDYNNSEDLVEDFHRRLRECLVSKIREDV